MFKEVEEVIEGSRKYDRAVPVENMENRTGEAKVRSLNHLGTPKLEDRVDSKYNLEQGKGFGGRVVLEDVFTPYGEEGNEFGGIRQKVGTVEGGMGKQGGDVRVLDGLEVPEPPEVESGIRKRRVWEGEVTGGGVKWIGGRSAH